jgi:metal-responsive CopG/Arc/MetJ family transcriptional regulator
MAAPKDMPRQINVHVDDEMLLRIDMIAKKLGIGNRSSVVRQAVSRWFFELEKRSNSKSNGHGG